MIFRPFLFLIFILGISNASALSCMHPDEQRERAENAYLLEIASIDDEPVWDDGVLKKEARIKVLKIYKGDVERLQNLKNITAIIYCLMDEDADKWYRKCPKNKEDYPYKAGDKIIVFNSDDAIHSGPCASGDRRINVAADLREFEKEFKPIWGEKVF